MQAKPLMESGNLAQLADPKLEGRYDLEQLHGVVLTASYCVRQSPVWRPSMSEVHKLYLVLNAFRSISAKENKKHF